MKKSLAAVSALVFSALMLSACGQKSEAPPVKADAKPPAAAVKNAKPTMAPGSPPAAPELKFDANGVPIKPKLVAPAPPKPPGGPSAPELSPEALQAAKAALAKRAPAAAP